MRIRVDVLRTALRALHHSSETDLAIKYPSGCNGPPLLPQRSGIEHNDRAEAIRVLESQLAVLEVNMDVVS